MKISASAAASLKKNVKKESWGQILLIKLFCFYNTKPSDYITMKTLFRNLKLYKNKSLTSSFYLFVQLTRIKLIFLN